MKLFTPILILIMFLSLASCDGGRERAIQQGINNHHVLHALDEGLSSGALTVTEALSGLALSTRINQSMMFNLNAPIDETTGNAIDLKNKQASIEPEKTSSQILADFDTSLNELNQSAETADKEHEQETASGWWYSLLLLLVPGLKLASKVAPGFWGSALGMLSNIAESKTTRQQREKQQKAAAALVPLVNGIEQLKEMIPGGKDHPVLASLREHLTKVTDSEYKAIIDELIAEYAANSPKDFHGAEVKK